jgi:RNA polymerase sigma factor (sigma-70 family)
MSMSQELFAQLAIEYRPKILRAALKMMHHKEDAEDVVQMAMLQAFKHKDDFSYRSSFGTWLHRIMLNELRMFYRARKCGRWNASLEKPIDLVEYNKLVEDENLRPDILFANKAIRLAFEDALDRLPPSQKDVALLRFGLGMTLKEMAQNLNKTEVAVKAALHVARAKLKVQLVGVET